MAVKKKISKKQKTVKLNLGCGHTKLPGYIGVDINPNAEFVDVSHNLNVFPYPFKESSVDEVFMEHVLEHLDDPLNVIQELYRISKPGGILKIKTPHFSCTWIHPGHKSAISTQLFNYFIPGTDDYYGNCEFKVLERKMAWLRPDDPLRPNNKRSTFLKTISNILSGLANMHQGLCERIWCYWVGGFEEIRFTVEVIKRKEK